MSASFSNRNQPDHKSTEKIIGQIDPMLMRDRVIDVVRDAIISGALKSGQRVKERELISLLGISRSPLREALRTLESEGFLTSIPNRGVSVSQLSAADLHELVEARIMVETYSARLFIKRNNDRILTEIEGQVHRSLTIGSDVSGEDNFGMALEFHDLLVIAGGNNTLIRLHETFKQHQRRYQYYALSKTRELRRTKMSKRIVDLSVTLTNNMPAHKFFPKPIILPHFGHDDFRKWGLGVPGDQLTGATTFLGMVDHVGTHVDSFFHMGEGGETIDEMPLGMFMGRAICLDLTNIPDLGDIDVVDLESAQTKAKVQIDGHIVLINTGLHNRHFPSDEIVWTNPGITAAATNWLADRGSKLHGVEGPSTDRPTDSLFPNHRTCRDRRISHYEWLCNLEHLVGRGEFFFQGLPLKICRGSGSPVRAVATID